MSKTTRRFTAGMALLLIGLSLASAVTLTAPHTVRADPGVLYAAPTAQGSGNCSSWANACTLQTALTQAISGDEIWVKAGVHYPTDNPADRTATFQLKNGVALYGGFAGTETQRDQRDWQANLTILSGDIDQNDINTDGNYIAETWNDIQGNNAYHVVTASSNDSTAVLDGFVVTAGQANGGGVHNYGGGIYATWSDPTLTHITFSGNFAAQLGGGMYGNYSAPALTHVTFSGNRAAFGGGMYNNYRSPSSADVAFTGNSATQRGGGMYNVAGNPLLTDVTFSSNSAPYGGGLYNDYGNPTLTNATFSSNNAVGANGPDGADGGGNGGPGENGYGGGIYNGSGNLTVTGSMFVNNAARGGRGGIGDASTATYCYRDFWGSWHCTYGHPAGNGGNGGNGYGGAIYNASGNLTVSDVTFQDNRVDGGQGGNGGDGSPSYSGNGWYYSGFPGGNGATGGSGYGGGVYTTGTLNLDRSNFLHNVTKGGQGGYGGGNSYGGPGNGGSGGHGYGGGFLSQGITELTCADFSNNVSEGGKGGSGGNSYYGPGRGGNGGNGHGGAIYLGGGSASAINLVLSGNSALFGAQGTGNPYGSPGSMFGGGIANASGSFTAVNATLANNTSGYGGGVYNQSGTLMFKNTIIAYNTGYANHSNCSGSITSGGFNLDSGTTCNFQAVGDLSNTDPLLANPASGNLRLQLTSPAIDAGNNAAVPPGIITDLDGNPRFVDIPTVPDSGNGAPPIVDMGAYEAQYVDLALGKAVPPPTVAPGQAITFALTLTNTGSLPAAGIVVTDTLPACVGGASFTSTLRITDTGYTPPYVWLVEDLAPGQGGVITISGVLTAPLAAGTYTNTAFISAASDLLAENNTAVITFTVPNVAPAFTSAPVLTATQDAPYTYTATSQDDNGDLLTITAPTLPSWLTLDWTPGAITATLSGTPSNADVGDHAVMLLVTDSGGLTDTQSFTVTVVNVNDAPTFTSAPVLTATQDTPYTYTITADDPDLLHGDILTITVPTLPSWLTLGDHGDGTATLSGTPTNADVGDHPVVLRVADSGGLTDTQAFTITVANVNDAPTFTSAPVLTVTQDAPYTYAVTADDPDLLHGDILTITAPTLPSWLTLEDHGDGTATLSGTPTNAEVGDHPVVLRVADSAGAFAEQEFVITVGEKLRYHIYMPLVFRNWRP